MTLHFYKLISGGSLNKKSKILLVAVDFRFSLELSALASLWKVRTRLQLLGVISSLTISHLSV